MSATPASPENKKAAANFFQHPLPPHPESSPPFYVRLFEEHLAALNPSESDLVAKDYMRMCDELSRKAAAAPAAAADAGATAAAERSTPFQVNDGLQQLLEHPLQQFAGASQSNSNVLSAANDAWEKRRAAMRTYSQAFFQRAVTVVSANLQHADVLQAAGFKRRGDIGGGQSYASEADGLYIHVWRTSSEARHMVDSFKGLQQTLFEYGVKTIRAPIVSVFLFRGILYTVSPAIPALMAEPVPALDLAVAAPKPVDSALTVATDAATLRIGLGETFGGEAHQDGAMPSLASLGLRRGIDGRVYVTSFDWRTDNMAFGPTDFPSSADSSVWLRREAVARMDAPTRANIRQLFKKGGRGHAQAARKFIVDTLLPQATEELLEEAGKVQGQLTLMYRDNTVTRVLHSWGVPLRLMYVVYERVWTSKNATDKKNDPRLKMVKEALETEMILRTIKQVVRLEIRASPGEDGTAHVHRVNRLYNACTKKATGCWADMVVPILRKKFEAPADFNVALTAGTLKIMAAYGSSRLGAAYDKAASRFTAFTSIHQATTIFTQPRIVERCSVSAASPVSNQPTLNTSGNLEESMSLTASASMRMPPQRSSSGNPNALVLDDAERLSEIAALKDAWAAGVKAATGSESDIESLFSPLPPPTDHRQPPMALVSRAWPQPFVVVRMLRQLRMLRLLAAPDYDAIRRNVADALGRVIQLERDAAVQAGGAGQQQRDREEEECPGLWTPSVVLWLRTVLSADTLKTHDAEAIELLVDEVGERLGNYVGDDAALLGKAKISASKVNGFVPGVVAGAKMLRKATWVDVGLNNDYFRDLATCSVTLNVNSATSTLAEVFRLLTRIVRRQDVTSRRATLIAAYRKMGSALVSSQGEAACQGLRDAAYDGVKQHHEKFGASDIQTSVMTAHAVFVFVNSHASKLNEKQATDLRKFHYQVTSMGSTTVEQLKQTLDSDQYAMLLASMISILNDLGDTIMAEKALNQTAGATGGNLDSKGLKMASTIATLQSGAAGRLQRMVRMAANIGPEFLIRRIHRETGAYRQGLAILEAEDRWTMEREELVDRYYAPLDRLVAFEARQRERVYFFGKQHIYEVPPDLPQDLADAIDREASEASAAVAAAEKKERDAITLKKAMFNQLVRKQLGGRSEVYDEEQQLRDALSVKVGMAHARLKIEFQEGRTRVYGIEREDFVRDEVRTRFGVEAKLSGEMIGLYAAAAGAEAETQNHVLRRTELEAAETAIRQDKLDRARDEEVACLAVVMDETLHRQGNLTAALEAEGAMLVDGVQAEHLARTAIATNESAGFTEIREAHLSKSSALDAAMADKQALQTDETVARAETVTVPEEIERSMLHTEHAEGSARIEMRADGVTGGDALLLQCKTIGDQLGLFWAEEGARGAIAADESDRFGDFLAQHDQGAAAKREQRLEREALEKAEEDAREALGFECTRDHQDWHDDTRAALDACAETNRSDRDAAEKAEAAARDALEDDSLTAMLTWMRSTHAAALKELDSIAGERLEMEEAEERARSELHDDLLSQRTQWLSDLKKQLERERDAMAAQRLDIEEAELGARRTLDYALMCASVEEAHTASCDAFVANAEQGERAAVRQAFRDPAALRAIRAAEADRIEQEQRQEAERSTLADGEIAARRSLMREWLEATKEGVTLWMKFIDAASRFGTDEDKGRDAVNKSEATKRAKLVQNWKTDQRQIAAREEARRKAAERGAVGPVRQLHRAIKAQRVQELKGEEEVIKALVEVVRETEAEKQQRIHDKVAATKSKVRNDAERRRQEAVEEKRRQREYTQALTKQARAEEDKRLAAAREQHRKEREAHQVALQKNGVRRVEAVQVTRRDVAESEEHARESAQQRMALVEQDKQQLKDKEVELIAGRQPFSVAQSRKDALVEKAGLLERMRKERQILAAIRYLDAKDEEAIAEERRRQTRASELVALVHREALAEKRTDDVQAEVAVLKEERQQRASGEEQKVAELQVQHRARREAHLERVLRARQERHRTVEAKLEAIQRTKDAAIEDADRQAAHDADVAERRRDEATLLEQQRIDCKLTEMRHHLEEEGHLIKSPVKAPLPIRHLPPIKHDHTRILHQQAQLLQRYMDEGAVQHQPPPAALAVPSPTNAASQPRARSNTSRPASSGGTGPAAVMNDE